MTTAVHGSGDLAENCVPHRRALHRPSICLAFGPCCRPGVPVRARTLALRPGLPEAPRGVPAEGGRRVGSAPRTVAAAQHDPSARGGDGMMRCWLTHVAAAHVAAGLVLLGCVGHRKRLQWLLDSLLGCHAVQCWGCSCYSCALCRAARVGGTKLWAQRASCCATIRSATLHARSGAENLPPTCATASAPGTDN